MKIKGITLIIFIILIGSTTAYAASNGPNNSIIQNSPSIDIEPTTNAQISTTITKITAEHAKKIAKTYIEVQGAYLGNPKLFYQKASGNFKGGYVWNVPIMINCKCVNKIMIDAQTGANLGEK